MSSLFFYLFFYSFVEYVHLDTSTYLKSPGLLWGRGEMAERWSDRFGLCLRAAVLSVCSLCLIMFFFSSASFNNCPSGSSGPRGTGAYTVWVRVRTLVRRLVRLRVWDFGEVPAEENEVSERGFKLTLAAVDCAAPVGLRDCVSVSALSRVCFFS